ncbi:TRAP transporter small permease [Xenophilus arseniciresistens]|uniref:TRAP transporter small permease protein n=1 Tax=Xenophilus arseniciresistens TaxID=1283306 RepID=A0AAE3SZS7_9BURK|nr:TRAP transporter small permease [Xenophilus arseniciresistens]MDA7416810.1 TRAP transporter small permease [Xenophilus arseniciresistens]
MMMMDKWTERGLLGLHVAGAVVVAFLSALVCYDVAGRLLFNRPFAGTAEITATALVLVTFLQAPYAIRQQKLLRVSFVLDRLPPALRSQFNALAYLLGAVFFIAIAGASWEPAWHGLASGEFFGNDAFRVPAWPLRFGCMVLWTVAALVCLGFVAQGLRGRMTATETLDD